MIGDVSALMYSAALQTPKNEAFVKEFRAKYDEVPGYYAEANYTTAQMIDEAMQPRTAASSPARRSSSRPCWA